MAESGTLYNFGVLTKRYELISRTAGQFAPGVLGAAAGFVMILESIPMPVPFLPVLVGFWFALGRMPFGRHRGTKVRALVGPYVRFGILQVRGRSRWEMPQTWLRVAVDAGVSTPTDTASNGAAFTRPRRALCPRRTGDCAGDTPKVDGERPGTGSDSTPESITTRRRGREQIAGRSSWRSAPEVADPESENSDI